MSTAVDRSTAKGKERPAFLLALGHHDVPEHVTVDGQPFHLQQIFKHDSWAATALYACGDRKIVCKHNRRQSVFGLPMSWLGRFLASRERAFLDELAGQPGIPPAYAVRDARGRPLSNAVAHDFVPGRPMSLVDRLPEDFFANLSGLVAELHRRRIAYVDLHKRENVLVGDDGLPYLIDFQISVRLPDRFGFRGLFNFFAGSDLYHVEKHYRRHAAGWVCIPVERPWWIRAHRGLAVPFRKARRRFLVCIGVRRGQGRPQSELSPEVGLRSA